MNHEGNLHKKVREHNVTVSCRILMLRLTDHANWTQWIYIVDYHLIVGMQEIDFTTLLAEKKEDGDAALICIKKISKIIWV